jgi:hypothetical protein
VIARGLLSALAAWLVPSIMLGVLYVSQNDNPFWGFAGGVVGLIGALAAEVVRRLMPAPVTDEGEKELEALAQATVVANRMRERTNLPSGTHQEIVDLIAEKHRVDVHEGLRRLHEDIRREQALHPLRPIIGPPEDEPPERG